MWYGDTIWPSLVTLASIAAVSGLLWWERRRPAFLIVTILCIPAAGAAIAIERRIVTPREQVTERLQRLLRDFEAKDENGVVDAISSRGPQLRQFAARALDKVELTNVRLTDVNVELSGEDVLRARVHCRVTADVLFSGVHRMPRQPTRWKTTWEQEADGQWRLLDFEQLDPLTGEETQEARQYIN
jgi:uncharacterized iron-regulated membrane protein